MKLILLCLCLLCPCGFQAFAEDTLLAQIVEEGRAAAEKGDAKAQFNLGNYYEYGKGVTKDAVEAVKWYRKAAEQGHAKAQCDLGIYYAKGDGVSKDVVQAYKWFNLSAAAGTADAAKCRELLAKKMSPEQIAEAERMAREWKPKQEAAGH